MADLRLCSRAQEWYQKLTPCDQCQCKVCAERLLQKLQDWIGARIFVDESKMELTPYLKSTKDHAIAAHSGDAGDAGINQRCCSEGLMMLEMLA